MKALFKLGRWFLAGITGLLVLVSLGDWLAFLFFAAALAVLLPVTERLFVQKLSFLRKGIFKLVAWLLLLILAFTAATAEAGQIRRLEADKDIPALVAILQKEEAFAENAAEALGNIGDSNAVEPLITALKTSEDSDIRRESAIALGKLQDSQAADPLIASLKDDDIRVQTSAKEALKLLAAKDAKVVDKLLPAFKEDDGDARSALVTIGGPAVKALAPLLDNPDLRSRTASVLGDMNDPLAIEPLTPYLVNWEFGPTVGPALEKLGWEPEKDTDKVHLWVALRRGEDLRQNWSVTQQVLLEDVKSGNADRLQYGLYSLISIGQPEAITSLVSLLKKEGNKDLALAYLNCGEATLEKAAEDWAAANGYEVVSTTEGSAPVSWGEW
ncbi:MAG TPA: HEAT repeat domain-containing protein [Trichocoleus sp.]